MKRHTARKFANGVASVIILSICLIISTIALMFETFMVSDNLFRTGRVKIDLNGGKPVISEHELLFEPGMTIKRNFYIENLSSEEVHYRIYFKTVEGGLADILEITISDEDTILYKGTASDFTQELAALSKTALGINEHKELTATFHFPENSGNNAQNKTLSFDLCADSVQTRNNPDKLFD